MLPSFMQALRRYVEQTRVALGAGDRERLARIAHQVIGIGGTFGFDTITEAARQVQEAARGQAPLQASVTELLGLCEGAIAAHEQTSHGAPGPLDVVRARRASAGTA